ncbi:hypothetical protein ABL78_4571 [Leptomonas seymouri]|uniref:Uncharacterized protein n=1 Tax=Leptomonas seymouri TaxID=5684 RepID=A0A0N1HY01_LEPSE|nr:hypothetical protein ABL78_4571 [Leptomonas seymouri]|eukprot:KPI86345.1 hypothetical protein ABL78_4571 [Leptomonas seymouri]
MDVTFIAVDTRTGFHLASRNLKAIRTQTTSKDALAVLCSSVLFLYRSISECSKEEVGHDRVSEFVVDASVNGLSSLTVQYFHAQEHVLCVVFGTHHHTLYKMFASNIAACLLLGNASLKDRRILTEIAENSLKDAFHKQCSSAGVASAVLIVVGPMKRFSYVHGHAANLSCAFDAYVDAEIVPGRFVVGALQWSACALGAVRCIVAADDAAAACFEKVALDGFLVRWALNLGLGVPPP